MCNSISALDGLLYVMEYSSADFFVVKKYIKRGENSILKTVYYAILGM